ncbi:DUF3993 domain-containing protein [Metabacillus mangrovi]|nr:DUF3993 domain-containing protein [Metabacillus mangrovi]
MKIRSVVAASTIFFFSFGAPAVGETAAPTIKPAQAAETVNKAETVDNTEKVNKTETTLELLQDAYQKQISLGNEERSKQEMKEVLEPYFTEKMADVYLKHNAVKGEKEYIVYGTDFPILSIPFFAYDSSTKIKDLGNKKIVYQYFEKTDEGPVTYEGHYESVTLVKEDGHWKVASISESLTEPK